MIKKSFVRGTIEKNKKILPPKVKRFYSKIKLESQMIYNVNENAY